MNYGREQNKRLRYQNRLPTGYSQSVYSVMGLLQKNKMSNKKVNNLILNEKMEEEGKWKK